MFWGKTDFLVNNLYVAFKTADPKEIRKNVSDYKE